MRADYHVHTIYSDDSVTPMEDAVKDAISKKMDEICFCDHVDYGVKRDWDDPRGIINDGERLCANVDYPKYVAEILSLRRKYEDVIRIKMGMEFGMQEHTIDQFQKLFDTYDFDFIILSNHEVNDKKFWNGEFQKGKTQDEYQREYYDAIYNIISKYKDYSVLGHLDLIKRYDSAGLYPDAKAMEWIDRILKTVIADGKGIEINTSSWQYGLSNTTPSREILRRYLDLGGKIITIGSDAHTTDRILDHEEEAKQILKEIGFKEFCTFNKMKPIFHSL